MDVWFDDLIYNNAGIVITEALLISLRSGQQFCAILNIEKYLDLRVAIQTVNHECC